jgi:tRNA dimethylallyltransferase
LADSEPPRVLHVICGPTAAGKSRMAMACAQLADIAIIGADSRQVYRGFDIGTATPSLADRQTVPHHGIDVLDPPERASAGWWAGEADGWIRATLATGRMPVVVGGTGLYLRALFGTLFAEPPMDPAARRALEAELAPLATEELRRRVADLDPPRAHLGRTQLLRAIEIATLTGRRMSDLHREQVTSPRWRARYLVVDPGPVLATRIEARTTAMFDAGWVAEVQGLLVQVPPDAPAWNASGYGVVRSMIEGALTQAEARERVIIETRQYAKRQRTWFRHQLGHGDDVGRLDASATALAQLERWLTADTGGADA